jgi:hypothetical protein
VGSTKQAEYSTGEGAAGTKPKEYMTAAPKAESTPQTETPIPGREAGMTTVYDDGYLEYLYKTNSKGETNENPDYCTIITVWRFALYPMALIHITSPVIRLDAKI